MSVERSGSALPGATLEERLRRLGSAVALQQDAEAPHTDLSRARMKALDAPAPLPARSRWGQAWPLGLAAAFAVVAVVVGGRWLHRTQPLALVGRDAGATFEAATEPVKLAFSDGSSVELTKATSGRVLALKPDGAELRVERGHAVVHVNPQSLAHWRFHAGSLVVEVTGTRFDLGWSPETERASLALLEGSVMISGCGIAAPRRVRAPETVELSCPTEAGAAPAPARVAPNASLPQPATAPAEAREPEAPRATSSSWQALARSGKYKEAHASAVALGLEQQLGVATGSDLLLLGDVSRYAGSVADAVTAYKTARKRFPGTDSAAQAAFALGRLAFDQQGAYAQAASHFETYLRERPRGSFAPEARGRRIDALERAGNGAAAHSAAVEYLRLYPAGPYAAQARKLVQAR